VPGVLAAAEPQSSAWSLPSVVSLLLADALRRADGFPLAGVARFIDPLSAKPEQVAMSSETLLAGVHEQLMAAPPELLLAAAPELPLAAAPTPVLAAAAAPAADEAVYIFTDILHATEDPDAEKDRWMVVRTLIAAMLAEPVIKVFGGCNLIDVDVLARALINAVSSSVWIQLAPAVTPVVFLWQFLLLARKAMDESPFLCRAVGELTCFCISAEEQTLRRWEAKAGRASKDSRRMW